MPNIITDNTIFKTTLAERLDDKPALKLINPKIEDAAIQRIHQLDATSGKFVKTLLRTVADQRKLVATGDLAHLQLADRLEQQVFGVPDGCLNRHGLLKFARDLIARHAVEINKLMKD